MFVGHLDDFNMLMHKLDVLTLSQLYGIYGIIWNIIVGVGHWKWNSD